MKKFLIFLSVLFINSCTREYDQIIDFSLDKEVADIPLNQDRNLYFGDLHVHTKYSFDAYLLGTNVTPDMSY